MVIKLTCVSGTKNCELIKSISMVMHSEWDIATHSAELYLAQIKQDQFK